MASTKKPPTPRIEVFRHGDGQWGFRVRARNGQISAQSEGYGSKTKAIRGARGLLITMIKLLSRDAGNQLVVLDEIKLPPGWPATSQG